MESTCSFGKTSYRLVNVGPAICIAVEIAPTDWRTHSISYFLFLCQIFFSAFMITGVKQCTFH